MSEHIKCWEFFKCQQIDCPVYKAKEEKCWLVSGTCCRNENQGKFLEKIELCLDCEPFKRNVDLESLEETLESVNEQFSEFRALVDERDRELEETSMELALGLSEVFEALKNIASGNPAVRLSAGSQLPLLEKLKELVNETASNIGEIVDLSHEFAMGLAEHFDALHRVSTGDLDARVKGTSQVELLERLKEVTNGMIQSVSREISNRKLAEEELQKAHDHLERRVKERTIELVKANEELKREVERRKRRDKALKISNQRLQVAYQQSIAYASRLTEQIAERRKAEEALRESEATLQLIFRTIPTGLFMVDLDKKITYWNKEAERITGLKAEDIVGKDCILAFQCKECSYDCALLDETKPMHQKESTINIGDREIVIQKYGDVITDANGKKIGGVRAFIDITERKRAEAAVRESEQKYISLVENSLTGIYIDQDGRIVFANNRFAEIYGYQKREMIGIESWKLVYPEDRGLTAEMRQKRLMGKGVPEEYDARGVTKDGETIWLTRRNIRIEYKGRPAVLGNVVVITERKEAEGKLLSYHERLRSLASELSLAEERERRRVANEVHDRISQNLAFVKMRLGTLQSSTASGGLKESVGEMLELMDETIQNTRSLISELGSPILYELGFVPAVEWLTQQTQRQHGIVVAFQDDDKLKPLRDDVAVLLFQAARELLVNIVKHAQARHAKVSITRENDHVQVDVQDDGVGFDCVEIGSSVCTSGEFGLFSIQERLYPLGGRMEMESKRGEGTRVSLVAPLDREEGQREEKVVL